MRECFSESIEARAELKEIDLSVKLKDLTEDSFFAIHYHQLKSSMIPNASTDSSSYSNYNPFASFLVYFRINPKRTDNS